MSQVLQDEIVEVIDRPAIRKKVESIPERDRLRVPEILAGATHVDLTHISPIVRDPSDDMVIATPVAGNVEFIGTEDKDLLDIGEHRGILIVTGRELLDRT